MTTFEMETEAHSAGFDLSAMREEWVELSKEKGWPVSEDGWRRYLSRAQSTGTGPKRAQKRVVHQTELPGAFVLWWRTHRDAGYVKGGSQEYWNIAPRIAFNCLRYREEWRETLPARRAA